MASIPFTLGNGPPPGILNVPMSLPLSLPFPLVAGLALLLVLVPAIWAIRRRQNAVSMAAAALLEAESGREAVVLGDLAAEPGPVQVPDAGAQQRQPGTRDVLHRLYAVAFDDAPVDDTGIASRAGHADVVAGAATILARIETQPRYTPRRPQLLPQLMRAVNDTDASLQTMANIIAQDPTLAGNLLRITNSPLYRIQSKPIESIERAVTVVGTEGIRLIIAAALVQPVMNVGGSVFGRFPSIIWEHTLLSAAAAADHAKLVEHGDAFAAQLLGLLQGLGAIIVVQVVRDEYARQPTLTPDASVAASLLDAWAGPTARRIAQSWGLSDRIGQALDDQLPERASCELSSLGRSLRFGSAAGALALLRGLGRVDEAEALTTLASFEDQTHAAADIWHRIRGPLDGA